MQVVGMILGGLVATYIALAAVSLLLRTRQEQRHARLVHELLRESIRTAAAEREVKEQARRHWGGVRKFEVVEKQKHNNDVCSFLLESHDGKPLPLFKPGQFLTFVVKIPGHEKPLVRCYSLSSAPDSKQYRVTIKHVPDGLVSGFFHEQVHVGTILDVQAPRGKFCIDPPLPQPVVLIGGGVGITPLLSMLRALSESNTDQEAKLFYSTRHDDDRIISEELAELEHSNANIRVITSLTSDPAAKRLTIDRLKEQLPSSNYDFYLCGPSPMMSDLITGLREWGVPAESIHTEAFGTGTVQVATTASRKEASTPATTISGEPISVSFTRSGKTAVWETGSNELLSCAEKAGVSIDAGCRTGSCGTCATAVRSGSVRYLQPPDFQCETGTCLPCIAVPEGSLELDA
jgi:ferredoxin-NADP reductase